MKLSKKYRAGVTRCTQEIKRCLAIFEQLDVYDDMNISMYKQLYHEYITELFIYYIGSNIFDRYKLKKMLLQYNTYYDNILTEIENIRADDLKVQI